MYRGRKKAGKRLYGCLGEQYGRLWDYCETLRRTNPGSCVMLKFEKTNPNLPAKFHRLYMSLAAMKKGFLEGCRPVIGLDGCFLKGPYKGILLAAVGRDANNNMYPIAIAVVESETKDSWTWFLECLVSDLGSHERHTSPPFISDRQKGLIPSFDTVIPMADHRICVRHLYANFQDNGFRGVALKELLWKAALSYTEARDKPILTMLEMIRKQLMRTYQLKRDGISKLEGKMCPRIVEKLEAVGEAASDYLSHYSSDGMFEVVEGRRQYVVDIRNRKCGYRRW
ncbi:uncharacterized protein LOC133860409 [Alnus glutinosa]|uniref:uncharacterized protein LOC133860409 n=1 Tax=Alnus glutinosa TaxID=3517 RepID=UPI002D77C36E|nr:uncharacterized protein LOC133860409 [Alnus glutinosa]